MCVRAIKLMRYLVSAVGERSTSYEQTYLPEETKKSFCQDQKSSDYIECSFPLTENISQK